MYIFSIVLFCTSLLYLYTNIKKCKKNYNKDYLFLNNILNCTKDMDILYESYTIRKKLNNEIKKLNLIVD